MVESKSIMNLFKRFNQLNYIDRCSNVPHIKPYSVAQHSFYAALYGMVFARLENERLGKCKYVVSVVIQRALVHDLEESITGDILFPLHDENPDFKEKLDFIREKSVEEQVFNELSPAHKSILIRLWKEAKDDTPEGQMVACMDKFEILMYVISEIELGNKALNIIHRNAVEIIKRDYQSIVSVIRVVNEIQNVNPYTL